MLNGAPEYSSASDYFSDHLDAAAAVSKRNKNKRRFSDDQIRSLEIIFESDAKIEPRKKTQLAKELGLQPRQVAIWFQNRRARWKSKQIEKDYGVLLADFNDLASRFESLNKEKQSLLVQLQKLKSVKNDDIQNQETDGESDYTKMKSELKNIPTKSLDGAGILASDDSSIMAEAAIFGLDEENEALKRVESSSEDWGSLDSDDLINQTTESCQWWDFWC